MEDTAEKNEDVPDGVVVLDAVPREEDHADGIGDAARDDQCDGREPSAAKSG